MVDGTGLENQQVNASQVRILSLPPGRYLKNNPLWGYFILCTTFYGLTVKPDIAESSHMSVISTPLDTAELCELRLDWEI